MDGIYFDNAATSPLCEAAKRAIENSLSEFCNPSSAHGEGYRERVRIDGARRVIARCAGVPESGVIFTSGGTEADNLALLGGVNRRGSKVVITDSEHPAVKASAARLEKLGWEIVFIPTVGGELDLEALKRAVSGGGVCLVSVMHVNNETGAVFDVKKVSDIIKGADEKILFHCDCVQSFGKRRYTLSALGADMISVSAHKIGGPKGVGALITNGKVNLSPVIFGGGQENGIRSGTENTLGIKAFAAAANDIYNNMEKNAENAKLIRNTLKNALGVNKKISFNEPARFDDHVLSIRIEGVKSEVAIRMLSDRGLYVSAGSACSSKKRISPALKAFGLGDKEADSTLRLSFGAQNTAEEAEKAASLILELCR